MDLQKLREIEKKQAKRIAEFLLEQIEKDQQLRDKILTTDKTLEGCINYVKKEAQKHAENGFAWIDDNDVWGWVIHYYLEDNINCEQKASETKDPKPDLKVESIPKPSKHPKEKTKAAAADEKIRRQLSLFDFGLDEV